MKGNKEAISIDIQFDQLKNEWKKEDSIYLFKILKEFQIENFSLEKTNLDFDLLDKTDGKFNIKQLNFDNTQNAQKFIEKVQNLEEITLTDLNDNYESSELFYLLSKHHLKSFTLESSNGSFEGLEEIVNKCSDLSNFIMIRKYPFKKDEAQKFTNFLYLQILYLGNYMSSNMIILVN